MTPKPVLLISPSFFGYEHDIARAFAQQGCPVDLIDERPSNSAIVKAAIRIELPVLKLVVDRYYRQLLNAGHTYGRKLVLVIKGEVVPVWFLEALRRDSPDAVLAFYSFDSAINNSTNFQSIAHVFDHLFSFQTEGIDGGGSFRLKHLFYGPEFVALGRRTERRYQATFVGTLHSDRYRFAKRFTAHFSSSFIYFYVQARWFFIAKRLVDPRYREVRSADVRFKRLSRTTVADLFRNSHAVLDMQHEFQTGLTMRSFEAIASGAYLVTTNPSVIQSPLAETGRVILSPMRPTEAEMELLVKRVRGLPVLTSAPPGFDRFGVSAWVEEFVNLIPENQRTCNGFPEVP